MQVENFLEQNGIEFIKHEHPAVYTCEEADLYRGELKGMACKNLFLTNKKRNKFYLYILPANKKSDLKSLSEEVSESKLTFASPEEMKEKLNLEPGSVSPFGLLNENAGDVVLLVDREVVDSDIVSFHPNRNTATLEITKPMFQKFLGLLKNEITTI
jgi:Ala-tRNA(Pro) deacylase